MKNKLLTCPKCAEFGIKQTLGSVNAQGNLVVMRFRTGLTVIQSTQYTVVCQCGFGTTIINTQGNITYPFKPQQLTP